MNPIQWILLIKELLSLIAAAKKAFKEQEEKEKK
jgi:hypothetical protein